MKFSPIYGYIVICECPSIVARQELLLHSFYNHVFCTVGHADTLCNSSHKTMTRVSWEPSIILVSRFGWIPLAINKPFFSLLLQPSLVTVIAGRDSAIFQSSHRSDTYLQSYHRITPTLAPRHCSGTGWCTAAPLGVRPLDLEESVYGFTSHPSEMG